MTAHQVHVSELEKLSDDGDTLELESGAVLRLRMTPDQEPIDDIADHGDVYGRTQWTRGNDYGAVRPDGFTGAAEILRRDDHYALWWEPYDPNDIPGGRDGQAFRDYRQNVCDIMEYGFHSIGLELQEEVTDSRGGTHLVELESVWLGGIEPFPTSEYVREVVGDLASELESLELIQENGANR